jgi:hypothetical protein
MLKIVPIIPFHNSFNFILLFLKFSPIIPKITPHQVEPRPGENKNFINIMDVELEIFVGIFNFIWNLHTHIALLRKLLLRDGYAMYS